MTNPPQEVCGFEFVSQQELPDNGVTSLLYRHKVHGCPFIFLKTKDSHNAFSCTFRTAPIDDSGRSHMLEHLVLDGTQKYPVKDLFSEMSKRSFSTYMNAMTANQWTSFPFSTINKQDYFNILDVYLDSCFHPQLNAVNFMSECFHVEFEDNDPTKSLINGGVVYNEMRGSFNSFGRRIGTFVQKNIFPDSPERFVSGGIPECIAKSTIEDIRDHHSRYYHPSNAIFYHYGNIPIEEVFAKVNEVISPFPVSNWKFSTSVFHQPKWTEPKRFEIEDGFDPMQKDKTRQYRVLVSYLTPSWEDPVVHNDIDFLVDLLIHGDSSPMYKAILKPGLAVKFFQNGFSDDTYNTYVTFGFEGVAEADVDKVISLIQETLEECYKEGFDQQRADALIHENELYSHELTKNMGLTFFSRIVTTTCYGIDPHKMLDSNFYLDNIRAHLKENPKFYQEMIKKVFLDNNHKLTVVVKPVDGFLDRSNNKIKEDLAEKKAHLKQDEIDQIIKNFELLKEDQEKPQPIELLPSIKKSDIDVVGEYVHITKTEDNVSVLAIPLNQMTHITIRLIVDFTHPLIKYLPLLAHIISKVGAAEMDEEQMDVFTSLHCSGVDVSLSDRPNIDNSDEGYAKLSITTKCLDRNIDSTIQILNKIIFEPHIINPERVKALTKRKLNALNTFFQSRGDALLARILPASLTNPCALYNVACGPYFLQLLNELIEKDDWNDVCQKLEIVYKEIFLRAKARAFVHTTKVDSPVVSQVKAIIKKLNDSNANQATPTAPPVDKKLFETCKQVFIETEASTNFTAMSCRTVPYTNDSSVLYGVLDELMSNEFLHQLVRVQLGAYGVWAIASSDNGIFSIRSYRDPNPQGCIKAFWKALEICASGEQITDEMVDRAIVKVFAAFDSPEAPSTKGFLDFNGKPEELIQKRRKIVYNATKQQLVDIAKKLKESTWTTGILSSKSTEIPEGFQVLRLTE